MTLFEHVNKHVVKYAKLNDFRRNVKRFEHKFIDAKKATEKLESRLSYLKTQYERLSQAVPVGLSEYQYYQQLKAFEHEIKTIERYLQQAALSSQLQSKQAELANLQGRLSVELAQCRVGAYSIFGLMPILDLLDVGQAVLQLFM